MAIDKDAWVAKHFNVDIKRLGPHAAPPATAQQPAPAVAKQPEMASAAPHHDQVRSLPGTIGKIATLPIAPVVDVLKDIFDTHICRVSITNNTDLTLTLDPSSEKLESGTFKGKHPKKTLKPDDETDFEVDSKSLLGFSVGAVEGTIRYTSATPKLAFSCHFHNPRLLSNSADAKAEPSDKYSTTANADSGDDAAFTFSFEGGNGGGDKPNGGEGGVAASCRVSVVNQTQQTIFLRKQDKAAGDYVTNPASSLAPGAKTDFVFAQTPNSKDGGCRGLMSWEVGDPKQATWDLMFDNVKGGKNLSAGFLDPKDGGLHSLDQIDDGDENVPVTFTLSGAGGGGQQPTGKPLTCSIVVANESNLPVTLISASPDGGSFKPNPPATIAAGGTAVVKMTGPDDATKTASGYMEWSIGSGQPGEPKTATWAFNWTNPPGAKNTASGTVMSDLPGLLSTEEVGDGDQEVGYTFTLAGEVDPQPAHGGEPTSCAIMVTNGTDGVLTLAGQHAAQGEFKRQPPKTLAPGGSALVTFTGTKDAPDKGASGTMSWTLGDPAVTTWSLEWHNPPGDANTADADFNPKVGGLATEATVPGQGDDDVPFTFTLTGKVPAPVQTAKTSCMITVKNDTQAAMTLVGQTAESGSFVSAPPKSIAPGQSAQAVFAGPDKDPKAGAAGSMTWQIGDDAASTCVMHWANPPGEGNTADAKVASSDTSLAATAVSGTGDENVPVNFDVTGGNAPKPTPDDDFAAPPKSKQPTLRKGDDSPDGWIEYAQTLLTQAGFALPVTGKFDGAMLKAVKDFQAANHCQVDGTIGNETWSVLRKAAKKDAVGVDGRKPHSFEETGAQARFFTEDNEFAAYVTKADHFTFILVSTGEQKIDGSSITAKVTQKDGTAHTHKLKIGSNATPSPDGQGASYRVTIEKFKSLFQLGASDPAECDMDAYLDSDIGGDRWTGKIRVM